MELRTRDSVLVLRRFGGRLGVGVAIAVALDATIVRALLVPATMRLFGKWNWWAPRWMRRLYEKAGLSH